VCACLPAATWPAPLGACGYFFVGLKSWTAALCGAPGNLWRCSMDLIQCSGCSVLGTAPQGTKGWEPFQFWGGPACFAPHQPPATSRAARTWRAWWVSDKSFGSWVLNECLRCRPLGGLTPQRRSLGVVWMSTDCSRGSALLLIP